VSVGSDDMGIQQIRLLISSAIVASGLLMQTAPTEAAPAEPPRPAAGVSSSLQADEILTHLERTIAWFHRLQALEPEGGFSDVVSQDRLRATSTAALQLSFDFARAAVPLVSASSASDAGQSKPQGDSTDGNLDRAVAKSAERVATLQSRLTEIDARRAHAPASARGTLDAQRDEVEAALSLAKDVQGTVQNLAQFAARGTGAGQPGAGLAGQIAQLERSVPEARHTAAKSPISTDSPPSKTPARAGAESNASPFRPESAGLIALAAELLTLRAHKQELNDVLRQTDAVLKGLDDIRKPLVGNTRQFVRQTDSVSSLTHDVAEATRTRQALQNAAAEFKQLSTVMVPLAEQAIAAEASRDTLAEWRDRVSGQVGTTAWFLLFRVVTLIVVVAVVLLLSEIWRRATFRYLHDARRRRQFLLLRRVAVSATITIVVILGVVSEVGSLATYVGFVTAGIAVAMQNVILAVVAYFFLIGRYGVRAGDRITLGGVTGNVIDIGLVRIYLMELAGGNFHPTGRIVVLSNAVLFQPAALFKQVPGADYLWHVVTLTVAAAGDAQLLETRLRAAAESVYEDYRPSIEEQHATLQRYVNIETLAPNLEVTVRLTAAGLECTVRYPAEPARAAATDRKMIEALRAAVANEPGLTLISFAGPTVE
jgi:small-conductance mechanosensitive channel